MSKPSLDEIGILEETSKCSLAEDYLDHYEELFARYRQEALTLIEIGVSGGGSARMWERFFPHATIVGLEINKGAKLHEKGRVLVEIGSQGDADFLRKVAAAHPPTIVIDDGSHLASHLISTFETLFPLLAPGGCYVMEDLYVHLGRTAEKWSGGSTVVPFDYLAELARDLVARRQPKEQSTAIRDELRRTVDRIGFIGGAALIWKKPAVDLARRIEAQEALVRQTTSSQNWNRLAGFILQKRGPLEKAEAAARAAIELAGPHDGRPFHRLSEVLARQGDLDGAIQSARRAVEVNGDRNAAAQFETNLARLMERRDGAGQQPAAS